MPEQTDEVTVQSCSPKHGLLTLPMLDAHCSALLSLDNQRQSFSASVNFWFPPVSPRPFWHSAHSHASFLSQFLHTLRYPAQTQSKRALLQALATQPPDPHHITSTCADSFISRTRDICDRRATQRPSRVTSRMNATLKPLPRRLLQEPPAFAVQPRSTPHSPGPNYRCTALVPRR